MGEASSLRDAQAQVACEARDIHEQHMTHHVTNPHEHHQHLHHHHQIGGATTAFHVSRPSHTISTIIAPPPPSLHHTSIILDEASFHVPRILLPNDSFQVTKQPLTPLHNATNSEKFHSRCLLLFKRVDYISVLFRIREP